MKKLNRSQIYGIVIAIIGLSSYSLVNNDILQTFLGIVCAIGLGFALKWLPIGKQNTN